ncbi:MAG: hypothetical protein AMXMBFR7_31310 [Planctomycetota bacterium]
MADYSTRQAVEASIESELRSGKPPNELVTILVDNGWSFEDARVLVVRIYERVHPGVLNSACKQAVRSDGIAAIKWGSLLTVCGLGLTLMTYMQARQSGGDLYLIFPGLIVVGLIALAGGLYRWVSGREPG